MDRWKLANKNKLDLILCQTKYEKIPNKIRKNSKNIKCRRVCKEKFNDFEITRV